MAAFEDEGYFCVDNLPSEMIRSLVELFMHTGSKVARAAVVSDVRGGSYFEGLAAMLDELRAAGVKHRVLFLEADEQTLLTRYKETRRRHPLAPTGSVADGIARERELLRAAARAGRRGDRHHRADRGDAPAQAGRRAAAQPHPGPAGGDLPELRLQVGPGPRPRPAVRRPLPAQPALRARAAAADRRGPPDRRVHQPRRRARRLLRPARPAARLPAARSTWPRARPTWWWRSAAPAAATARWRSPTIWPSATRTTPAYLVEVVHRDVKSA